MKRIIYDIGSNNGDDIPYYLLKSDMVVSVEANPDLANHIRSKFAKEIDQNRVLVENCVITDNDDMGEVDFYLHKKDHTLSQFPIPLRDTINCFEKIKLPSKSIINIINKYGTPYYIKLDVEHYEVPLLNTLFKNNIRPPFISAEAKVIEVFEALVNLGKYNVFKLVNGWSIVDIYKNRSIEVYGKNASVKYSFPYHSSGPFGHDLDGLWLDETNFRLVLKYNEEPWKDIHATTSENLDL
jgi:FkbM family methyltransferase